MSNPSRTEDVERALQAADNAITVGGYWPSVAVVLADEVRWLRAERALALKRAQELRRAVDRLIDWHQAAPAQGSPCAHHPDERCVVCATDAETQAALHPEDPA